MTTLARGSSVTLAFSAGGMISIVTTGGVASVNVAPERGVSDTQAIGPSAQSRTLGPFVGETTVTITNTSAALNYTHRQGGAQDGAKIALVSPRGLLRWRRALDDAQFAPAEIHCVGGSTIFGWGADNPASSYPPTGISACTDTVGDSAGWVGQLRRHFAGRFAGSGANAAGYLHATQTAVTRVGGGTVGRGRLGYAAFLSSSGPGTLTFALPACTGYDIDFWENPTTGTFSHGVDGGEAASVTNGGATATYRRVSVTGLSNATHSLVITGTSVSAIVICGVRYHSGYGVAIGRHGRAGWTMSDALGQGPNNSVSAALQADLLNAFGSTSNALTIIAFGSNDFVAQATSTKTDLVNFESLMRTAVAKNTAAGGCTLLLGTPDRDPDATPAPAGPVPLTAYWDVMRKIANDTPHVAHARHSDALGSWAVANAAGLMADHAHPYRAGHGLMASTLYRLLTNSPVEMGL